MKQLPPADRWIAIAAVLSACSTKEEMPSPDLAAAANVVSLVATEYAIGPRYDPCRVDELPPG